MRVIIIFALCILSQPAFANSGITYSGRLIAPNGNPVISAAVQFKIQLRTPGNENCLMYEEIQVKDLSLSSGVFSVTINDGTGSRTDTSGYGLDQIFANRGSFAFGAGECAIGAAYAPNASDGRRIQVHFNDGSLAPGVFEPVPAMAINFVPMAIESQQVGGYKSPQLLRVAAGVSTANTELDAAKLAELLALIDGTSTQFIKPNDPVTQLHGAALPAPVNGESIRWNSVLNAGAGGWENFAPGASGVTQVTAGTGLNVGGVAGASISTTGTLNVNVGTAANQIVQLNASAQLPGVDGSNLTGVSAAKIGGTAVSIGGLASGNVLKYDGTNWINGADNDTLGGISCVNGQVPYYNAGWTCLSVATSATASTVVARDAAGGANFNGVNATEADIDGVARVGFGPATGTTLSAALAVGDVVIPVVSTAGYPSTGAIQIGMEAMTYTGITATTFTGVVRGAFDTTAAAHAAAAAVKGYNLVVANSSTASPSLVVKQNGNVSVNSPYNAYGFDVRAKTGANYVTVFGVNTTGGSSNPTIAIGGTTNENQWGSTTGKHTISFKSSGNEGRFYWSANDHFYFADYGGKLATVSLGTIGQAPATLTTLSAALTNVATTVTVVSTAGYAKGGGILKIEDEIMHYTGTTATTFTGVVRGQSGTVAAAHALGTPVNSQLLLVGTDTSPKMTVEGSGNVGIGTASPQATLDINGTLKLKKNSSEPAVCTANNDGTLALTSAYQLCACKGGTGWVSTADGVSGCSW